MAGETMIERVARTICQLRNAGDCRLGCTHDTGCLTTHFDPKSKEVEFAIGAIEAMRQPDFAMLSTGTELQAQKANIYSIFTGMIDAALQTTQPDQEGG